jgi:hypothetical protein
VLGEMFGKLAGSAGDRDDRREFGRSALNEAENPISE